VAILGAGPIGLITTIVAAAFGADAIAITDISDTKLGFASQHCPRVQPLLIKPGAAPADVAAALTQRCFQGSAPEVVIDCAGFQQTLETGLRVVAPGGRVVLVGMGQEHMKMSATLLTVKEVDLLGSFRYVCGVQGLQSFSRICSRFLLWALQSAAVRVSLVSKVSGMPSAENVVGPCVCPVRSAAELNMALLQCCLGGYVS
jgi:threonine dehydrogenase-like Zn-dependent dehydrogenase